MVRATLIRLLLWLAHKLGHESDLDYYARLIGMRRLPATGSRAAIQHAIEALTPAGTRPSFCWADSPTQTMLQVEFTRREVKA